ncbi:ferritin-like domain-containing protein [Silvibacterium acidisoli]|uniref:ferritin-like domain-containing protein n=1 Tax=Acidobacteriaceae bacterium ZG23-2 TaxID=2883246 RepID=UPI00406D3ED6
MSVETAHELFVEELKDIYSGEKQAIKAYPRLVKAVRSESLRDAMQAHLAETQAQLERLEQIFELLEERPGGKTCNGMKGLLEEAFEHKDEIDPGSVLDAAMIGALQRVEDYEIAAYGTVVAFAEATGQTEILRLLEATLMEEKQTDEKLSTVAHEVNEAAIAEAEGGQEEEDGGNDKEGKKEGKAKKSRVIRKPAKPLKKATKQSR